MSRFRRAIHGVAASYVLLLATAVYALASVPVALHYLDKERFGLWALMTTLANYLNLIDAGMSSAAARLLIDCKDDRAGGSYGSLIKTGTLVLLIQGLIIFLTGLGLARNFAHLLAIPAGLQPEFIQLVHWQCGVLALNFATRMFGMILNAHQRMDWVNYLGVLNLLVNFISQWALFHYGFGVLSLAGGALAGALLFISLQALVCHNLKLFPAAGTWGHLSWLQFKEMFNYGKDVFLVSIGTQLIMSSQIIVITRLLGLEAAATWSVGLRIFNLLSQLIWRLSDMSGSALAEMLARCELARLRERYRSLAILSFSFAGWLAVSFAICNSQFVTIWTHGKINWPQENDWLLALWMIVLTILQCHNKFVLITKQVGFMRYVYFIEGIVFVGASCLSARWGGLPAIICCSILCSACFSGTYGIWRITRFFQIPVREVALGWLQPMSKVLQVYIPFALLAWWVPVSSSNFIRLGICVFVSASIGGFLFLRFGVPDGFQTELIARTPTAFGSMLKRVFNQPNKQRSW